ncbi:Photosystem II reaction center protein Z [Platanthera guangdongensis]|uniref:Photosystem II reaction center protein Z n=1 Tax=Platanthera guangdongensis TaxID=2320717 RepID=A0ABR2MK97_9ASPA
MTSMTIAFQLAVFALIATSLILLISVPVVFASSDDWSSNKNGLSTNELNCSSLAYKPTSLYGLRRLLYSCFSL